MNKFLGICICLLTLSTVSMGQEVDENKKNDIQRNIVKPSRDFFMFQLSYENWLPAPEGVNITGLGRGFAAYLCYDWPINKSNFSFAAGVGINTQNIYFKKQIAVMNEDATEIFWRNVDTSGTKFYKNSKLNTAYLEAPFELRYFANKQNRNRGFKIAVGMKVGLLVGAHTKVRHSLAGPVITEKVNTRRYVQTWRFAPSVRVGWGNFSVFGSYGISPLFNEGQGPEVYPISLGITISGL